MLEGLMQHDHQLTLQHVLERMRGLNGDGEVVTLDGRRRRRARRYAEVGERVDRLCRGARSGSASSDGDRVATFAWNSPAAPRGLPRRAVHGRRAAHAQHPPVPRAARPTSSTTPQDKVIFVDDSLVAAAREARADVRDRRALRRDGRRRPRLAAERDPLRGAARAPGAGLRLPRARRAPGRRPLLHERHDRQPEGRPLLAPLEHPARDGGSAWPTRSASARVRPRAAGRADVPRQRLGPARTRRAWPAPTWSCPAASCRPSRWRELIESEQVTVAGARADDLARPAALRRTSTSPTSRASRIVICGGAAVPRALMQAFEERHGVQIIQAWGMTETSPLGLRRPPAGRRRGRGALELPLDGRADHAARRGAPVDDDGEEVPWDGESTGELEVRGPWIAARLLRGPGRAREKFDDGWLRTGDVASIDARRLHPHHRPRQGRDQVRRRVDLLGRARERADGATRRSPRRR